MSPRTRINRIYGFLVSDLSSKISLILNEVIMTAVIEFHWITKLYLYSYLDI